MESVVRLGPFMIPVSLLALLASFFITVWLVKKTMNKAGWNGGLLADVLWTAFLAGLLIHRFGYAALHPIKLVQSPLLLLMGQPPAYMAWLGTAATSLYTAWKLNRYRIEAMQAKPLPFFFKLGNLAAPAVLAGIGVYQLFLLEPGLPTSLPWGITINGQAYHPLHIYQGIGLLLAAAYLFSRYVTVDVRMGLGLFLAGIILMITSFLALPGEPQLGLTMLQWNALSASILGLFVLWRSRK